MLWTFLRAASPNLAYFVLSVRTGLMTQGQQSSKQVLQRWFKKQKL